MDDKKVLVAYASVSGSTAEVAAAIGEVLANQTGLTVQVEVMKEVTNIDAYDAVVAGSSIRAGRWLPEAKRFIKMHQEALSQKLVAYFTTCLTMVEDTADSRRTVLAYIEPILQMTPKIKPVGIGLFAGSLDPSRNLMMPVEGPQGDYRDWETIGRWAREIASILVQSEPVAEAAPPKKHPIILHNAVLAYTNMSGADLQEIDLTRADLYKTKLNESNLQQATLKWAELNWSNLSGANLSQANLIGAQLTHANLDQANLSQAILNGADLSYAKLSRADLSDTDLNWANLHHANLSQANLSGAKLGWANLSEADLSEVNLTNAKYNRETQWPEGFSASEHGAVLVRNRPR